MSIRALLLTTLVFFTLNSYGQTMELAYFKSNQGVSSSKIIEAASAMQSTISQWQGFVSRELVQLGDDQWVDIVRWDNEKSAQLAVDKAMHSSVCLTFFALITSNESDMQHGEIQLVQ
ncbi:MAG: hypothetical protein V7785_11595 [Bermanella sp.]